MSLDKAIKSGKEHRKPYRGAKSIDCTCRNHGSCEWCRENRTHKNDKREMAAEQELSEYEWYKGFVAGILSAVAMNSPKRAYPYTVHDGKRYDGQLYVTEGIGFHDGHGHKVEFR